MMTMTTMTATQQSTMFGWGDDANERESEREREKRWDDIDDSNMEAEVTLADIAHGQQQDMMKQQIFSAGAALSGEDFNHSLEIRKRKSDEMGGGGHIEIS